MRLTGVDVLAGCVAADSGPSLAAVLRLVQSLRWFGGGLSKARFVVCVPRMVEHPMREQLESYEAEVRIVAQRFWPQDPSGKSRLFGSQVQPERKTQLLLDADALVLQDPLPWIRGDVFMARATPVPAVAPAVLERVFMHYGIPLPEVVDTIDCNAGVMTVPIAAPEDFSILWSEYRENLATVAGISELPVGQIDQISLALALAKVDVPFAAAPPELDFQLESSGAPPHSWWFTVDPAIVRSGHVVDSSGQLGHTPYPFAQVRAEAFNRRLKSERTQGGIVVEGGAGEVEPEQPKAHMAHPASVQAVVLGMHRSGTSALTAMLREMGFWAGSDEDFPQADDHNEAGYWEHRAVWSIDEAILQTIGASWSDVADLEPGRLREPFLSILKERARNTIRELDAHGPWVVKDPRLCLLFPFWRELLERPFCILLHRDPLAIAHSLAARDGFSVELGIALWEKYTREALSSTSGVPRILISQHDLMTEPETTLRRLRGDLMRAVPDAAGIEVPPPDRIRSVVRHDLVHHSSDPEITRKHLNAAQQELLDSLRDGTALDVDPVPPLSSGARQTLVTHRRSMSRADSARSEIDSVTP